jgi:hypothetical protein
MPQATSAAMPLPVEVKRLPWMRRIHLYSPKLARMLVLFSYRSIDAWSLIESCPRITRFCEHPGHVVVDGQRVLASFLVEDSRGRDFIVLDDDIALEAEDPRQAPLHADATVVRVTDDWFDPYRQWIANWLRINPYLVANARFITATALERVAAEFVTPRPLFDAEHALREMDRQLARTAIFMLLHRGRLRSDDLMTHALSETTVFYPPGDPPRRS